MTLIHTKGGIPDTATTYSALISHLREAQSCANVLGHLHYDNDRLHAGGWHAIAENLDLVVAIVTELASKGALKRAQ